MRLCADDLGGGTTRQDLAASPIERAQRCPKRPVKLSSSQPKLSRARHGQHLDERGMALDQRLRCQRKHLRREGQLDAQAPNRIAESEAIDQRLSGQHRLFDTHTRRHPARRDRRLHPVADVGSKVGLAPVFKLRHPGSIPRARASNSNDCGASKALIRP